LFLGSGHIGMRKRVHEILGIAKPGDTASKVFDVFILALIALNVVALILSSVQDIQRFSPRFFLIFETFSVAVFTVEYGLRLWSCIEAQRFRSPVSGRLRFALTPLALIDLLAILPFYLPFTGLDLRFLRAVRMMRIFRVAKVGRYSQSIRLLKAVADARKEQLICTMFILLILLVMASSMMYFAENPSQPEAFSSIPTSMWWAVMTLTTVGYGDVSPVTALGKVMASIIAVLGIGMFALPTGILGAGFVEELERNKGPKTCPHCGERIDLQ